MLQERTGSRCWYPYTVFPSNEALLQVRLSDLETMRQLGFKDTVGGILTTAHPATLSDGSIVNFTSDVSFVSLASGKPLAAAGVAAATAHRQPPACQCGHHRPGSFPSCEGERTKLASERVGNIFCFLMHRSAASTPCTAPSPAARSVTSWRRFRSATAPSRRGSTIFLSRRTT